MYKLDFHGDDYAISLYNSKRMIELVKNGHLDSFSIIGNMSCFDECMDLLRNEWDSFQVKPRISVHINLIDGLRLGKCKMGEGSGTKAATDGRSEGLAGKVAVGEGSEIIQGSWMQLFLKSLIPGKGRDTLKSELKIEIAAQIKRVYEALPEGCDLRLDSHVHTHMIPMVFDAMMEAVEELGLLSKLRFVRVDREPLFVFLTTPATLFTMKPANVIKNRILYMLCPRVEKRLDTMHIPYGMMYGLYMSGHMDYERMKSVMPKMLDYAQKEDKYLEILCHPGRVLVSEALLEFGKDDLEAFFSKNRDLEYDMLEKMALSKVRGRED